MSRIRMLLLLSAALPLAACGADDVASPGEGVIVTPTPGPSPSPSPGPSPSPTPGTPAADCPAGTADDGVVGNYRACRLPSEIITALTLPRRAGTSYEIDGPVNVGRDINGPDGVSAVLTIEPGVIIHAKTGDGSNDYLIVNRGSQIKAEGTAARPIVFTAQDNLTGAVTDASQGLWGGVILAGRAPVSNCLGGIPGGAANCENVVEGTGTALYGGNIPGDSSGTFRYVQIRYSGTVISTDNELQGLTLGGVGSGTIIDHVQIHNSSDDGIEVFGGRANMKYLVITGADDDSLDTDVGYQGFIQFVLAAQRPGSTQGDNYMMEIDSNGSEDALPRQWGRISNFTFIQRTNNTNAAIRLRGGADFTFVNGIIVSPNACLNTVASNSTSDPSTIRPANPGLEDQGPPVFHSVFFACATPYAVTTQSGVTISSAQQAAFFNAGTNNTESGTDALTNVFYAAGAAATTTPFAAASLNLPTFGFMTNVPYIGAVRDANDDWFVGWTCNSDRLNFGDDSGACTALPSLD